MKFNFRLASVLKIRRHQKRKEEQKLSALFNRRTAIEEQIESLRAKCRENISYAKKESVSANRRYYMQKHRQHEDLRQLKHQLGLLKHEVEEQRKHLTRAVKLMRMIEKIRDREKRAFIDHAEHMEQLQQNEIAIQQFNSDA
jgi:flagellar export protein FliJ